MDHAAPFGLDVVNLHKCTIWMYIISGKYAGN